LGNNKYNTRQESLEENKVHRLAKNIQKEAEVTIA
jgi:hypothetical protein